MNHLAHALLAAESPLLLAGNLAGDFVKGRLDRLPSTPLMAGIRMHRSMDSYTDRHPVWRRSRRRVEPRRVSGIIVDIAYDHVLARNFERYCDLSLEAFAARAYRILLAHRALLPPRLGALVPRIVAEDWLVSYRWPEGVERTFARLGRRLAGPLGGSRADPGPLWRAGSRLPRILPGARGFRGRPAASPARGSLLIFAKGTVSAPAGPHPLPPAPVVFRGVAGPRRVPSGADCTIRGRRGPPPGRRAIAANRRESMGNPG